MPRTGSTWLCSALDNHPEIVCDGEVFHGKRIERHSWGRGEEKVNVTTDRERIECRNACPSTVMREIEESVAASGGKVYGFKHILSHSDAGRRYIIENSTIDVVVLSRENLLSQFVSRQKAMSTGAWTSLHSKQSKQTSKVVFRLWEFLDFCYGNDMPIDDLLREAGSNRRILHVTYENLFNGNAVAKILRFLDLPVVDVAGKFEKQSKSDPYETFENPVAARISYTAWRLLMPRGIAGRARIYRVARVLKRAAFDRAEKGSKQV